jgi:glycerol-3-phosphate acyltransferase PlsY
MTKDAIIFLVLSYLCGSIPVGLLTGKMVKGIDVRDYGSGNIGATNVWRTLGPACGFIVFCLDIMKGFLPVSASHLRTDWAIAMPTMYAWMPVLSGLAAIIGHNFSPFLKFKGGKGVATSLGVALGLSFKAGLIGFGVWCVIVLITRYISVASIIAVPVCSVFIWWFNHRNLPCGLFGILATVFAVVKHKSNIKRLKAGTEPKVVFPWMKKPDDDDTQEDTSANFATNQ